jgi:hypothetical protein
VAGLIDHACHIVGIVVVDCLLGLIRESDLLQTLAGIVLEGGCVAVAVSCGDTVARVVVCVLDRDRPSDNLRQISGRIVAVGRRVAKRVGDSLEERIP